MVLCTFAPQEGEINLHPAAKSFPSPRRPQSNAEEQGTQTKRHFIAQLTIRLE
jgi:hypothetical protein